MRRPFGLAAVVAVVATAVATITTGTPAYAAPTPPHNGQQLCKWGVSSSPNQIEHTATAGMTLRVHNTGFWPIVVTVKVNGAGLLAPLGPQGDWVHDYGDIHTYAMETWNFSIEKVTARETVVGWELWAYKCNGDFNSHVTGYGSSYDDRDGAIADAKKQKAVHEEAMKASCREIPGAEEGHADGPGKPYYYDMKLDCVYWGKVG
jgi:hypothetical protein